jgi:hypothetical protein
LALRSNGRDYIPAPVVIGIATPREKQGADDYSYVTQPMHAVDNGIKRAGSGKVYRTEVDI